MGHYEFNHVDMTAGQYLEVTGTDLTDIMGSSIKLHGRMVVKEA